MSAPAHFRFFSARLAAVFVAGLLTAACGGASHSVGGGPRGTLRLNGEPSDALLDVDDTHLGPVGMFAEKGLLLKPGAHRVVVRRDGYFPEYRLVEIEAGEIEILSISLRPLPE